VLPSTGRVVVSRGPAASLAQRSCTFSAVRRTLEHAIPRPQIPAEKHEDWHVAKQPVLAKIAALT